MSDYKACKAHLEIALEKAHEVMQQLYYARYAADPGDDSRIWEFVPDAQSKLNHVFSSIEEGLKEAKRMLGEVE